jgi:hypothetical protein
MIERVARAIAWRHHNRKQWVGSCPKSEANDFYADREWRTFVGAARAAIEAMREPDDAMFEAGAESLYGHPREKAAEWAKEDKYENYGEQAQNAYRRMIDAALKTKA